MSLPDRPAPLPARDGEPTFAEPWQAEVLGIAFSLIEAGRISNADWSQALGAAIKKRAAAGLPDDSEGYYLACLEALEQVAGSAGMTAPAELAQRKSDWIEAYRATPHGAPVRLHRNATAKAPNEQPK